MVDIENIRALSIQQPWIDLILRGVKTIEVRTWEVTRRGGIMLHASRKVDWKTVHLLNYENPLELTRGALVAYAEISDVIKFTPKTWLEKVDRHRVVHPMLQDSWGLVLGKVKELSKPIPMKGARFFFEIPLPIMKQLREEQEMLS